MDKGIDASLGLDVALMTLQRLRKSGILKAEVSHIPGVRGRCRCSIEIVGGKITSCTVEDTAGSRYSVGVDVVIATNQKRGPFTWSYHPQTSSQALPSPTSIIQASPSVRNPYQYQQPDEVITRYTIPVPLKKAVDASLLSHLSANEKVMLGWIISLVDGQRTVEAITILLPRLSFEDVKQGLLFLKRIGMITLLG